MPHYVLPFSWRCFVLLIAVLCSANVVVHAAARSLNEQLPNGTDIGAVLDAIDQENEHERDRIEEQMEQTVDAPKSSHKAITKLQEEAHG
jgi:queuine/archaeosine tRNA-ribosyltransferase